MKARLTVTQAGNGWLVTATSPDDPAWRPRARTLLVAEPGGYPRPPADEAVAPTDPLAAIVGGTDANLRRLQQNILLGDVEAGDVAAFGSYLFKTLLGPTWKDVLDRFPGVPIDLEIDLPVTALGLQALPWEMMFSGGTPLVTSAATTVSITRLVAPRDPVPPSSELGVPIKLLFVVGKLDAKLRPGAEYLGLLRQLGSRVKVGDDTVLGAGLHVRVLLDAMSTDIQDAATSFQPHVVHIVAHGRQGDAGAGAVVMLTDRAEGNKIVEAAVTAEQLVLLLRGQNADVPLPHLVVVNACETANPGDQLSFAADLVVNGVPAAVGMAGEVQDAACRMFTAAFYRALSEQASVAQATAFGQRAAILHYKHYSLSAEWGRPALFLAPDVATRFAVSQEQTALAALAAVVRGKPPALCGRYRELREYQQFIAAREKPGAAQLLAYEQATDDKPLPVLGGGQLDYQIGKSRLLNEIKWLCILDGYLPCHLPGLKGRTIPNNVLLFGMLLAEAMDDTRTRMRLEKDVTSSIQRYAFEQCDAADVKYDPADSEAFDARLADVKKQLTAAGPADYDLGIVARRIQSDIEKFLADGKTRYPSLRGALVLVDDLHRYEGVYPQVLRMIDINGLGTAGAPAPVVATYSPGRGVGQEIRTFLTGAEEVAARAKIATLKPFEPDAEGQIAYGQFLQTLQRMPMRSPSGQTAFVDFVESAHEKIHGVPGWLPVVQEYANVIKRWLTPIDDAAIFSQLDN